MIKLIHDSWDKVSVNLYSRILEVQGRADDGNEVAQIDKEIEILAILCDSDSNSISQLHIDEFTKLMQGARFLLDIPDITIGKSTTIHDKEYRVMTDIECFSVAQYVEWQCLRATPTTKLSQLLACILIPKGAKSYGDGYKVSDVAEEIGEYMQYADAHNLLRFFARAQLLTAAGKLRSKARALKRAAKKCITAQTKAKMEERASSMRAASIFLGGASLSR